jgi:hypothetical protein
VAKVIVDGLSEDEQATLSALVSQLEVKRPRSSIRDAYYDGRKRLDKYGISIPPQMQDLETVIGWPAKTCDVLSSRLHLGGFVVPGESSADTGIEDIFAANGMSVEMPQAHVSTFIHGVSFVAVTGGDTASGEPDVLIQTMPATEATGLWDGRRRRLAAALWMPIPEVRVRKTQSAVLYLADQVITLIREPGSKWVAERVPHNLGRVPVVPLRYRPRMGRPFGMSRISRAVISLTDQAVRTMLRTEVSAEFYSSPQRYMLGADESAFVGPNGEARTGWEMTLGKVLALSRDEDDQIPTVGQFPQMSMQPHADHLRSIAMMFAGETAIPPSNLGIIHDNPASAEAIDAAWADMVGVAELCQTELGSGWAEVAQLAVMTRDSLSAVPESLLRLRPKWRDPSTPTKQAQTQATVAQIQVGVLRPDSEVALEQLGYDQTDIERIQAEHRRAGAGDRLAQLVQAANGAAPVAAATADPAADATVLKAKFEALGIAVRAGVDSEAAAERLGLAGIKFTGAVPVSLRIPESQAEAASLEEV